MKNFRKERGITLVALIITVILMLILAGVAVSVLTEDGGLFGKTKNSAKMYEDAGNYENAIMSNLMEYINMYPLTDMSKVESLELNYSELVLVNTSQTNVDAKNVYELNVTTPKIPKDSYKWVSLDTNIATVDSNGTVTGISSGTTQIKCVSPDEEKTYAVCDITVEEREYLYYNGRISSFDTLICGSQGTMSGSPYFGDEYFHVNFHNANEPNGQQNLNLISTNQINFSQYSKIGIKCDVRVDNTTYAGTAAHFPIASIVTSKSCNYYGLVNYTHWLNFDEEEENGIRYVDLSSCNSTAYLDIVMSVGVYMSGIVTQADFYIYEIFLVK